MPMPFIIMIQRRKPAAVRENVRGMNAPITNNATIIITRLFSKRSAATALLPLYLSNPAEYHVHRSYAPHGRGDFISNPACSNPKSRKPEPAKKEKFLMSAPLCLCIFSAFLLAKSLCRNLSPNFPYKRFFAQK